MFQILEIMLLDKLEFIKVIFINYINNFINLYRGKKEAVELKVSDFDGKNFYIWNR